MSTTICALRISLTYEHEDGEAPDTATLCSIVASALGPISPSADGRVALREIHVTPDVVTYDEAANIATRYPDYLCLPEKQWQEHGQKIVELEAEVERLRSSQALLTGYVGLLEADYTADAIREMRDDTGIEPEDFAPSPCADWEADA